jgi:hypothetical protein
VEPMEHRQRLVPFEQAHGRIVVQRPAGTPPDPAA